MVIELESELVGWLLAQVTPVSSRRSHDSSNLGGLGHTQTIGR